MPIVTRVPAYQPPEPAPLPAIHLSAADARKILAHRAVAANPLLLDTVRANALRYARNLAGFRLIPRPVVP